MSKTKVRRNKLYIELNNLIDKLPGYSKRIAKLELYTKLLISFFVVIFITGGIFSGTRFVQRLIAQQICSLPSTIDSTNSPASNPLILNPDSSDGIIDCSMQDITITNGGVLKIDNHKTDNADYTDDWGVVFKVASLTIEPGGKIDADGTGYTVVDNPGLPGQGESALNTTTSGGSGGGHGKLAGAGGEGIPEPSGVPTAPGEVYGNPENAITLGGSGGNSGQGGLGGNGGGALKIEASGTVTIDGIVSANGIDGAKATETDSSSGGGGAGGSIWIEAENIAGSGTISANGGSTADTVYQGGGGGGGYVIAFCNTSNNFTGTVQANGGVTTQEGGTKQGSQDGGSGTTYGATCRPNEPTLLKQYRSDQVSEIAVGGVTTESTVIFVSDLADPNTGEQLKLEVELKEINVAFNNTPTYASAFMTAKLCATPISDCGTITATDIIRSKEYHWQARTRDVKGGFSNWVSYGGNSDPLDRDLLVTGAPDHIEYVSGNNQTGIVNTQLTDSLKVRVLDINGFGIPGQQVVWAVTTPANGGAVLIGDAHPYYKLPFTLTDDLGYAENTYRLGKLAGQNSNRIEARSYVSTNIQVTSSPIIFTVSSIPGNIDHFGVVAPQVAIVNANFDPVIITAYDEFDNIKTDYTGTANLSGVNWQDTTIAGTGSITPASVVFIVEENGIKTVNDIKYTAVESIKLKVADGLAFGYSNTIAVVESLGSCPDVDGIIDVNQTWATNSSKPNGWEGDIYYATNGIIDCRGLTLQIQAGVTLTVVSFDDADTVYSNDLSTTILADNFLINSTAKITTTGKGYTSGRGPGAGILFTGYCSLSNICNGSGAYGGWGLSRDMAGGAPYGDIYQPEMLGSSSGGGTGGGGALKLISSDTGYFENSGIIESNGEGVSHTGGGSGGSILINSNVLRGSGLISSNGGYGGGSGGRIAIYYNTDESSILSSLNTLDPKITAYGAIWTNISYGSGGPGTIYVEKKDTDPIFGGKIYVNQNNPNQNTNAAGLIEGNYKFSEINLREHGDLVVLGNNSLVEVTNSNSLVGDTTKSIITIHGTFKYLGTETLNINGIDVGIKGQIVGVNDFVVGETLNGGITLYANTWAYNKTNQHSFGDITVGSLGKLTLVSYDSGDTIYTNDYGTTLNVNNLTVASGGVVTANALGYAALRGPGAGYNEYCDAIAPSHGGYGHGSLGSGVVYGNVFEPDTLGSGAGTKYEGSVQGGGAIKIVATGTVNVDGTITANGGNAGATCNTGGSGGSIWIDTNVLSGGSTLLISAKGERALGTIKGAGGGGRIALYYNSTNLNIPENVATGKINTFGTAVGAFISGPGTIYVENKGVDPVKGGHLLVDNANNNGKNAGLVEGNYQFESIRVTRKGHLTVVGNNSNLTLASNSAIIGDASKPLVITEGILNYTGGGTYIINGFDLGIKGEITGVSNVDIGSSQIGGLTLYANTWAHNKENQYSFGDITVGSIGSLTLVSYDSGDTIYTNDYGTTLNLANLTVASGGVVTANALGYAALRGPGAGSNVYCDAIAPSHGGYGHGSLGSGVVYGSVYEPDTLGSGAGTKYEGSVQGGGAIKIVATGTVNVDGTISANGGGGGVTCNAGGSGGSIWIDTNVLSGGSTLLISAKGEKGLGTVKGSGGGGRIALYYNSTNLNIAENVVAGKINTFGASAGGYISGSGTIYAENKGVDQSKAAHLLVDNANNNGKSAGLVEGNYQFQSIRVTRKGHLTVAGNNSNLTLTSNSAILGDASKPSVITEGILNYTGGGIFTINGFDLAIKGDITGVSNIDIGSTQIGGMTLYANTWAHNNENQYTFGDITVGSIGNLTLVSYDSGDTNYTNDYGTTLNVNNLTVASGGVVSANALGYPTTRGPGAGTNWYDGGCQAIAPSHGGYGAAPNGTAAIYGSVYEPDMLGSGSGSAYGGTSGGGAIKLVATGTMDLNGTISADGGNTSGTCNTGGTGGSIWLDTNVLTGSNTLLISTKGDKGTLNTQGSGGGGRIALYYQSSNINFADFVANGRIQAMGTAVGANIGGPGTIYVENKGVDPVKGGHLLVDNGNNNGRNAGLLEGNYQFESIHVTRNGNLTVVGNNSNLTLTSNSAIIGDASKPSVITEGILNYTGGGIFKINGFDLGLKGDITGVSDLVIGDTVAGGMTLYANTWAHNDTIPYEFNNFHVAGLGVLTMESYDTVTPVSTGYGVELALTGNMTVDSGGIVTADNEGYSSWSGPGPGTLYQGICYSICSGSAGHGGLGLDGQPGLGLDGPKNPGGVAYGDMYQPTTLGSKSGGGAVGGGAIKINLLNDGETTLNGLITANGSGVDRTAGGSGGSIWLNTGSLAGSGNITVNGGYGGGAGGRVAIYYETDNSTILSSLGTANPKITAYGVSWSNPAYGFGGPGTIYIDKTIDANSGSLYIDNNNNIGSVQNFDPVDYDFHNLFVTRGTQLKTLPDTTTLNGRGTIFNLSGDFKIDNNAKINAKALGFLAGFGPAPGNSGLGTSSGAGGTHGGSGAVGVSDGTNPEPQTGSKYGDQWQPLSLGSGGGNAEAGGIGGSGGGSVTVISRNGHLQIDGIIDVSGNDGTIGSPGGGGGAGGSIFLIGQTCTLNGTLIANGGNGGNDVLRDGGGGGGGRISTLFTGTACEISDSLTQILKNPGLSGDTGTAQQGTFPDPGSIPGDPLTKNQYRSDAVTEIPVAGYTSEQEVVLKAEVSDPGASESDPKNLSSEFEVVEVEQSFTGTNIVQSDTIANYTGAAQVTAQASVPGLTLGTAYKWRTRTINIDTGVASNWVEFGANDPGQADFIISNTETLTIDPNKTNVVIGETITLNVSAKNELNNNDQNYRGRVHFTSTANAVVLPADYIFGAGDSGSRSFPDQLIFGEAGVFTVTVTDTFDGTLTAVSSAITVSAPQLPTNTPVLTNTPVSTNTPTPTTDILNTPNPTSTIPPGVTLTVTPTESIIASSTPLPTPTLEQEKTCEQDPSQVKCLQAVEISNVRETLSTDKKSNTICWDTNIETIGYIGYGLAKQNIYTDSSEIETSYKINDHCQQIDNLESNKGYIYKITAKSVHNLYDTHEDNFGSEVLPPDTKPPMQCVAIAPHALTSDNKAVIDFDTVFEANCITYYGYDPSNLDNKVFSLINGTHHSAIIDLSSIDRTKKLFYQVKCEVKFDEGIDMCMASDFIPSLPVEILPKTGEIPQILSNIIVAVSLIPQASFILANLYAVPWFKDRKKRKPWGIVFDRETKKPIIFASVKLYAGKTFLKEKVTDKNGKYGFIVNKGEYEVVVDHPRYNSYVKIITFNEKEGSTGENISLTRRTNEALNMRTIETNFKEKIRVVLSQLNAVILLVGITLSIIATVVTPTKFNYGVLAFYFAEYILFYFINKTPKEWGYVFERVTKKRIAGIFVRLFDIAEKRQLDVIMTDEEGRFSFAPKDGDYLITVDSNDYIFSGVVKNKVDLIKGPNGIFFIKIRIKKGKMKPLEISMDSKPKSKLKITTKASKLKSPFHEIE